jgi:hypothetical protein
LLHSFALAKIIFMEQIMNKSPRQRRSQEAIRNLLNEFENAGVSVNEFCNTHRISRAAFYKWQSRHKSKKQGNRPAGFANLHIIPSTSPMHALFAEVKGIKIYQPVSAAYLNELLQ